MSKDNTTTIRYWLILCFAGFSLGTVMGGIAQRNWRQALTTGIAGVPVMCISALLLNSGRQSARPSKPFQKKQFSPRLSSSQPSLQKASSKKGLPEQPYPGLSSRNKAAPKSPPKQSYLQAASNDLNRASLQTSRSPSSSRTSQVAIFWDYENVQVSASDQMTQLAQAIDEMAQAKGHCLKKCVYSNWGQESSKAAPPLTTHGFNAIHVAMGKPNSVDVKLAVDCVSTAYEYPDIKHFVLVTSDKDYISLINKLQELRRTVILVGSDRTSPVMRKSAAQFIPISDLLPSKFKRLPSNPPASPTSPSSCLSFEQGMKCLTTVLSHLSQQTSDKSGSHLVSLSQIDKMMRQESTFSYQGCTSVCQPESKKTFSKFSRFIEAVEAKGLVTTCQHNSRTHISLIPILTFHEAMQCVVYALFLDHQEAQAETYQDVNITYLYRLVNQYLSFKGFTPTKILFLRKDGCGHYATLSKFLNDVAKTKVIELRREERKIYIKLTTAPSAPNPPTALMARLQGIQVNYLSTPGLKTVSIDSAVYDKVKAKTRSES